MTSDAGSPGFSPMTSRIERSSCGPPSGSVRNPRGLRHATEDRPTLWERVAPTERLSRAYVEAMIWEMAARDRVVLVGRGSPFVLQGIGHALRVRVTASERVLVHRLAQREELGANTAAGRNRHDTRERAARIPVSLLRRWGRCDQLRLVLNTDRVDVDDATGLIQETLSRGAFQPTDESLAQVRDRSVTALAKAALLARRAIRPLTLHVDCRNGHLWVSGVVQREGQRQLVTEIVARLPGVEGTQIDIAVAS